MHTIAVVSRPVPVCDSLALAAEEAVPQALSSSSAAVAADPLARLRQKDGRIFLLNAQIEKKNSALRDHDEQVKALTKELQEKDQTIAKLQQDLARFQSHYKIADGRICLLRYQLEKSKQSGDVQAFQQWMVHVGKFATVTAQLKRAVTTQDPQLLLSAPTLAPPHTTQHALTTLTHHTLGEAPLSAVSRVMEDSFDLPIAILHKVLVEGQSVDESVLSALNNSCAHDREQDITHEMITPAAQTDLHTSREEEEEVEDGGEQGYHDRSVAASFEFISPIAVRERATIEKKTRERERERERETEASMISPAGLKNLFLAFAEEQKESERKPPLPSAHTQHTHTVSSTPPFVHKTPVKASPYSHMHSHAHMHTPQSADRERALEEQSTVMASKLLDYHGSFLSDDGDLDLSQYSLNATADLLTNTRTPVRSSQRRPSNSQGSGLRDFNPNTVYSPVFSKHESRGTSSSYAPVHLSSSVPAVPSKASVASALPPKPHKSITFAEDTLLQSKAAQQRLSFTEKRLLSTPALSATAAALPLSREKERETKERDFIFTRHRATHAPVMSAPPSSLLPSDSFSDQLARIRIENDRLRSDISRFKGKLDIMKQECASIRSHKPSSAAQRPIMS